MLYKVFQLQYPAPCEYIFIYAFYFATNIRHAPAMWQAVNRQTACRGMSLDVGKLYRRLLEWSKWKGSAPLRLETIQMLGQRAEPRAL